MSVQRNQTQGYSLAVDCLNARDFSKGIQHALQYASLRPRDVRVHELLGQLYEGKKDWKKAIESYKTALQIDPQKSKLGLKVVALYCQLPGEVERLRHWTAQVAKKYPDDPVIHQAHESIYKGTNQLDQFADYIRKQLRKDPHNSLFTIKLLECLQGQRKWSEALNQCDCMLDALHQEEKALQKVVSFNENLLSGGGSQTLDVVVRSSASLLVSLCYLSQALVGNSRTASSSLDAMARLAEQCIEVEPRLANLDKVMKYPCHKLYISEIRGQFQYLVGTYLLQLGLAGSLPISDVLSKTTALFALSLMEEAKQHNNLINLGWTLTPARILSRLSCNRVGQIWHFLRSVAETYGEDFLVECQRKWCSLEPQKEIYRQAFGTGHNLSFLRGPSFLLTNEPCQVNQNELRELLSSIFKINQESVTSDPENFSLLLWTCLQWDTREDNVPSDFGHFVEETFSNLHFSTNKLKIMTIDNLRLLDLEAFLYAVVIVVRSSLTSQQRGQSVGCLDIQMKNLPLLTIQQKLTMREQDEWFRAVYKLCHSKACSKEYSKLRVLAQRGLEVLRCGSNHGNETLLLVQLGRVMNERMMELKDTDGPGDRCRAYHAMSVMYWTEALGHLKKLANNSAVPVPVKPFFRHVHKDIQPPDIARYMDEGLVVLAEFCAGGGDVHQGLRYLEDVKSPEGHFLKANLYRQLAQEESVPDSEYQLTPTKLTSQGELLDKAKHSLYSTMDGISQNANHPLHEKVRTLLVDIESEQDEVARRIGEMDGASPTLGNESSIYHSLNAADTSPFREATNDPSPQRLASEIRSLNFSHMQMGRDRDRDMTVKKLLDRTLDQNQSMMEQQNKLMEQILKMKQAPPPSQAPTPQPVKEGPPSMGGGEPSILSKIWDLNEKMYEAMSDMKNQFQDFKKDVLDLKDKIGKIELEQERSKLREMQKQMAAAAAAGKAPSQTPSGVPSPAPPVGVPGASMIPGHKPLYQQPMYPTAAGVTYIPHPQYPGYMFSVDGGSLHPSMMTSTPSVRRSITPKTALPGFAGLGYDNGSSPTEEDEELKQQFVKGFGLGEPTEFPDSSRQMSGNQFLPQKGSSSGTSMRILGSWQSPSSGSIVSGTAAHSPAKPLQGMPGQKMDAATTLAAYAAAAGRQQSLMGAQPAGFPKPAATSVPTMASQPTANSLTVPKPIVTSVSTAKPSITQGHLIRSPTPASQTLPSQPKSSEGPAQSPFAGFSFKTTATGTSGFTTNPAFQSPKSTPVTTSAASSPFAGFSFKPSMLDVGSTQSSEGRATQQYPQLTALLAGGPEDQTKADVTQPGLGTPEGSTRKPGQSPMGLATTARSPHPKEDKTKDEANKGGDEDVVIVSEKKATPEQRARAEKLMLPPHFYLYEDKPPCPGCVGCDEEDLQARARAAKAGISQVSGLGLFEEQPKESAAASSGLFGGSAQPSTGLFSNASGITFASLSADGDAGGFKKDSSKPFAFANAGAPVFGAPRQDADHEDQEYDPHYEPIVTLPENVEIVTGDEDEDIVFKERAKLYRYDKKTGAWKERGVGNMKILQNPETRQARILMRREQVLKVCANHRLTPDMELKPMSSSDKAWVWFASDFADGEVAHEQLAIKFKFMEMATAFKDAFDKMKVSVVKGSKEEGKEKDETGAEAAATSGGQESQEQEGDMEHRFQAADPVVTHPAGDGEDGDDGDYDDDEEEDEEDDDYDYDEEEGGEYEDEEYDGDYEKPSVSLADQFRRLPGSWDCDTCMVNNPQDQMQCLACTTPKPGATSQTAGLGFGEKPTSLFGSAVPQTFSFKAASGFSSTTSAFSAGSKSNPGFTFGGSPMPAGAFQSSSDGGLKMPVGFNFGATKSEKPAEPDIPGTSEVSTGVFGFTSPAMNTNSNAETVKTAPDSTLEESAHGKVGPIATNQTASQKFTFGAGMPQFSFGSQSPAKPSSGFSFGSPGTTSDNKSTGLAFSGAPVGEKAPPAFPGFTFNPKPSEPGSSSKEASSFAGSSQFNFRLDVDNVATSPPKSTEDKPQVKSPGLNKSGEYYQSDERDDLHFEPIVTLPENVVLETGEESEEVKFTHRAKLYRFDVAGSQWKERGVGDIKVLYNPKTGKHRIVMRRDQVLKVCANHFITKLVDLQPNAGSARSWVWHAMDVSDGEVQNEQLAVRFKTEDAAKEFKEAVDEAKKTT